MLVKVVLLTVVLAAIRMNQIRAAADVEQVIGSSKDRCHSNLTDSQISQFSLANSRQEIESEGEQFSAGLK